jgi:hypothetical protein
VHQKQLFWRSVIRECQKQTSEMRFSLFLSLFVKDAIVVQQKGVGEGNLLKTKIAGNG